MRDFMGFFADEVNETIYLEKTDAFFGDVVLPDGATDNFDYDESAKRAKKIYKKWNDTTEQLLQEILIAYFSLKDGKGEKSFSDWCHDAGLPEANLVRKWILRFIDEDKYTQKTKEGREKAEQSAIEKSIFPIVEKMKISLSSDKKSVTIEIFGKKFTKKLS